MNKVLILLLLTPLFCFAHLDLFDSKNGNFFINTEISKNHIVNFTSSRDLEIKEIIINNINFTNSINVKVKLFENSSEIYFYESTFNNGQVILFNTAFSLSINKKYSLSLEFDSILFGDLFCPNKYPYTDFTNTVQIEDLLNQSQTKHCIPLISFDANLNSDINISEDLISKDFEEINPFKDQSVLISLTNKNYFFRLDSLGLSYYESGKDNIGNINISITDHSNNKTLLKVDSSIYNIHKSKIKLPVNFTILPEKKYLIKINIDSTLEKDGMILSFKPIFDTLYFQDSNLMVFQSSKTNLLDSLFPFLVIDGELEKIQNLNLHTKKEISSSLNSPFHPTFSKNSISFKLNSNFELSEIIEDVTIKKLDNNDFVVKIPHSSKEFKYNIKNLQSNTYIITMKTNKKVLSKNFIIYK